MNTELEVITSDEFIGKYASVSNLTAVYRLLQKSDSVKALQSAFASGRITEAHVDAFTRELLRSYKTGEQFAYSFSLAALAVALEGTDVHFAHPFLKCLSELELAEVAVACRIAQKAIHARHSRTANISRVFEISKPVHVPLHSAVPFKSELVENTEFLVSV